MIEDALKSICDDDKADLDVQADIILSVIDGLTIQKVLGINDAPIESMARCMARWLSGNYSQRQNLTASMNEPTVQASNTTTSTQGAYMGGAPTIVWRNRSPK